MIFKHAEGPIKNGRAHEKQDDGDNSEAGLGSWVEGGSALLGGGATAWWLNRNTPEKQNGCVDEMVSLSWTKPASM